jgi:glycerol-3-phosphate dehydrogenase
LITFPGLAHPIPSPAWCAENEFCCSLEDYLRRRTTIAQWIPRAGLGFADEHQGLLGELARDLYQDPASAAIALESYRAQMQDQFDDVIAKAG